MNQNSTERSINNVTLNELSRSLADLELAFEPANPMSRDQPTPDSDTSSSRLQVGNFLRIGRILGKDDVLACNVSGKRKRPFVPWVCSFLDL